MGEREEKDQRKKQKKKEKRKSWSENVRFLFQKFLCSSYVFCSSSPSFYLYQTFSYLYQEGSKEMKQMYLLQSALGEALWSVKREREGGDVE